MKFRKKIILNFSILIFVISLFIGIFFAAYTARNTMDSSKKDMSFACAQMSSNLTEIIDSMKHASDYLLSSEEMLNAMKVLSLYHKKGLKEQWEETYSTLKKGIYIDYFNQNFYRVLYFNEMGDVLSSTNTSEKVINKEKDISEITWLDEVTERKGRVLLIGPHEDEWSFPKNRNRIISVARKVWGGDYGYIEVQQTVESIKGKLLQSASDMDVLTVLNENEILFHSDGITNCEELLGVIRKIDEKEPAEIVLDGKKKIAAVSKDEKYGLSVVLLRDADVVTKSVNMIFWMSVAIIVLCFSAGISVVIIMTNRITEPIVKLREQMEQISLENLEERLGDTLVLDATIDEVAVLGKSYQNLLNRLHESVVKEKQLSALQFQAQFDALQAQVNPHFLYNVLNVISHRGITNGDMEICEICGNLASMLRYSTSTKERYATVSQELDYLDKYIYLLKSRYLHKLEFERECEEEILQELMPKIVLQQLVENSIQHGFVHDISIMKIKVRGYRNGDGWCFEVQDNGEGIPEEIMEELEVRILKIRSRILARQSNIEMEIGNMGLVNTYARMFLMYMDRTILKIQNLETGGLFVRIGVSGEEQKFSLRE